jgi:putative ABC transport system permease protein
VLVIETWAVGLIRRRGGRLAATAAGIAVAVAVLVTLGGFLAAAQASMTARAIRGVTVDWQVAGPANLLTTTCCSPAKGKGR